MRAVIEATWLLQGADDRRRDDAKQRWKDKIKRKKENSVVTVKVSAGYIRCVQTQNVVKIITQHLNHSYCTKWQLKPVQKC